MKFDVHWTDIAINGLSAAWLKSDVELRRAITIAANKIDREFQDDPYEKGESRPDGRRVQFESPLGVLFKVNARLRTVTITQVWLFRTHSA